MEKYKNNYMEQYPLGPSKLKAPWIKCWRLGKGKFGISFLEKGQLYGTISIGHLTFHYCLKTKDRILK